jgi:hypothetical protein
MSNGPIPRGFASCSLAAEPVTYGAPGAENLAPYVFKVIIISILAFAVCFSAETDSVHNRSEVP